MSLCNQTHMAVFLYHLSCFICFGSSPPWPMSVSLKSQTPQGQKVPCAKACTILKSVTENKDILLKLLGGSCAAGSIPLCYNACFLSAARTLARAGCWRTGFWGTVLCKARQTKHLIVCLTLSTQVAPLSSIQLLTCLTLSTCLKDLLD